MRGTPSIVNEGERAFLEAAGKLAYCNPFLPDRIEYEREALGENCRDAEPVWSMRVDDPDRPRANLVAISNRLDATCKSLRARRATGSAATDHDFELYEIGVLSSLYQRYEEPLHAAIVADLETKTAPGRVDFYREFLRDWQRYFHLPSVTARASQDPAHIFASFFQIRRAFHLIFRYIVVATSMAAARLRAAAWQSIFTHDMLYFYFLVAVLSALLSSSALAQLTKLNVGYSAISGDQLPAWIAKETGIFKKNGLDVQLIYFTGGTTTVQALVSGEVPISQVAGPAVVNSALAGSDIVVVAGGATSLDYWLMSRPEIKRPEQLKGGSVAISAFGTASDFVARYALEKIGLTPGKDVTLVQVGGVPDRLGALLAGRIEAAVLVPPSMFVGQKKGMNILADVSKLGLPFQYTGVATSRRFIKERRDTVTKYARSQLEAVHRIHTDKETSLKVLTKYFGGNVERDILEKSWALLIDGNLLAKKQYPSLEGIKFILAPLAEKNPKAKAAKPEDFADSSFMKELDQSGYADSLYRSK
jgi:NitT/TauT family transport system substrate-binding protein